MCHRDCCAHKGFGAVLCSVESSPLQAASRSQGAAITKAPPAVVQQQTSQEAKGDQGAAAAALVPTDPSLSEATTSTVDDDILAVEAADDVEVPFEEIELGPRIGVGCFGEVFKARWRQTTVAVKRLFAQTLSENNIKVRSASRTVRVGWGVGVGLTTLLGLRNNHSSHCDPFTNSIARVLV